MVYMDYMVIGGNIMFYLRYMVWIIYGLCVDYMGFNDDLMEYTLNQHRWKTMESLPFGIDDLQMGDVFHMLVSKKYRNTKSPLEQSSVDTWGSMMF